MDFDSSPLHIVRQFSHENEKRKKKTNFTKKKLSFSGQDAAQLTIRFGSSKHASKGSLASVKRIVQNPLFNPSTIDYDYSLLELAQPLIFNETVNAIKLPRYFENVYDNTLCLVTGWGNTKNSSESREILRGATVPIANQKKCSEAYSRYGGVTGRMICAGYDKGGKDGKNDERVSREYVCTENDNFKIDSMSRR